MEQTGNTRKSTQTTGSKTRTKLKSSEVFTAEEKAAMREYVREKKAQAEKEDGESAVQEKIAEMVPEDRRLAERLHAMIKEHAPMLSPKLWYGMPAYAKEGKIICFFQPAVKFKTRYSTLGFSDNAHLDEGVFWPVAYALKELTPAEEAHIIALVKKAVG